MPRKPRTAKTVSALATTTTKHGEKPSPPKSSAIITASSSSGGGSGASPDIIDFPSPEAFSSYLASTTSPPKPILLTLCKLSAPRQTLTYDAALRVALAHGWIDGQRRRHPSSPAHHFLQRFTPRRPQSLWSKRNVGLAEDIISRGQMTSAGMAEVQRAKEDGRWNRAYSGGKEMVVPEDFEEVIGKVGGRVAREFWDELGRGARFPFLMRLETCKTDAARRKNMDKFAEMLAEGKTL
ncbi:hypothetical protein N3K66_004479 [Trichothecium roseum]|uniref:Uncharacterized protein n=1 Tax=Trichothecium roseum TaxID=47278 RepID=A0ACC0V1H3_9HYPO|nr:hypothetical protein N3K66_004479 [Trichothecium roseum]